ncbi:ribonuclease HI family protein [Gephyromycinifex aptenodytis]|uniref:ribonuclease HI family protein n=1 Tax=Gephyromycinifex aptenodytis TaxID=2716227 RepID=UPI0014468670|nr:ribonuclease HI family protein [Gephyromycinifex aptenodytis]
MIIAAADGSSLSNPGPAGWAWYVDDSCWAAGGWPYGTNNMGELKAVLDLLQQTSHVADEPLHVLCDSQYVINSVTKWMPGWKRKGWRKADGKPVMNLELLKDIDTAITGRRVTFEWVKGHAGHDLNEAADSRAHAAACAFRDKTEVPHGPGFGGSGATKTTAQAGSVGDSRAESGAVEPSRTVPAGGRSPQAEPELDLFSFDEPADAPAAPAPWQARARMNEVDEVLGREEALLLDAVRSDRERVDALLHPHCTEIGASGRLWTRDQMLASIAPLDDPTQIEVVNLDHIADDVILLVWRSSGNATPALRSSIWVRTTSGWQMRFHQGTPTRPAG